VLAGLRMMLPSANRKVLPGYGRSYQQVGGPLGGRAAGGVRQGRHHPRSDRHVGQHRMFIKTSG
jgi:hypothetical protein